MDLCAKLSGRSFTPARSQGCRIVTSLQGQSNILRQRKICFRTAEQSTSTCRADITLLACSLCDESKSSTCSGLHFRQLNVPRGSQGPKLRLSCQGLGLRLPASAHALVEKCNHHRSHRRFCMYSFRDMSVHTSHACTDIMNLIVG